MAFASSASTKEPRTFSWGPFRIEFRTFTAASGDTSGTLSATSLERVDVAFLDGGLNFTAAPTYSGKDVTLAFSDPGVGGAFGTAILIGK